MFSLRRIVSRSNPATSLLRRPIHSTSTLRNAAASESEIYSKLNEGERAIYDKLKAEFGSKTLDVVDVSGMSPAPLLSYRSSLVSRSVFIIYAGGCGSFYAIHISSPQFKGLSTIKQHKLVNQCLKEEVKAIHGLQVCIFRLVLG